MPPTAFALAVTLGSTLMLSPPEQADSGLVPAQDPAPAQPVAQPQYQPQPQPQPQYQPQPQPQPWPSDPNAQPGYAQPGYAQPPYPPPAYVAPEPEPLQGIGMLITGPLVIGVGVPFAFLGNAAWRDNCGPDSSNSECADGSAAAAASHTMTGLAFATGSLLTAIGGSRLGKSNARRNPGFDGTGYIVGGAVLVPASLLGMGMVRLFLWLPTPECETYGCVSSFQTTSTIAVSSLALTTSLGAALLTYGMSYNREAKRIPRASLLPQIGRGYAGIGLAGQF
jgi:hypothetical protein